MLLEEMAELQKAILKLRRLGKHIFEDWAVKNASEKIDLAVKYVLEEIADVQIMLDQMRLIYGDTAEQEAFKLDRLRKRLEG
jgi:hypothetical protein